MQNSGQLEDLRVRRTRKLLQQALIELTIEKGFAGITVQDIAERAMVNRTTFYRHYLDKYDLLEKYMDELYELTEQQEAAPSSGRDGEQGAGGAPVGLVKMLEQVQAHANFYRVMLGETGDPAFVRKVQGYIEARIRALLPLAAMRQRPGGPPIDLCVSYMAHAGIGAIVWWLDHLLECPPERLARWLTELSFADVGVAGE